MLVEYFEIKFGLAHIMSLNSFLKRDSSRTIQRFDGLTRQKGL
jgi:hypothetical protein